MVTQSSQYLMEVQFDENFDSECLHGGMMNLKIDIKCF